VEPVGGSPVTPEQAARPYAPTGRMSQEALGLLDPGAQGPRALAPGQRANAPSNAGDMLTWDRYMGRQGYWTSSGLVADVVNVLKTGLAEGHPTRTEHLPSTVVDYSTLLLGE